MQEEVFKDSRCRAGVADKEEAKCIVFADSKATNGTLVSSFHFTTSHHPYWLILCFVLCAAIAWDSARHTFFSERFHESNSVAGSRGMEMLRSGMDSFGMAWL